MWLTGMWAHTHNLCVSVRLQLELGVERIIIERWAWFPRSCLMYRSGDGDVHKISSVDDPTTD